jgi:hypothetical protein
MLFNFFNRNSILRISNKYFLEQILCQFRYFITHFILYILNPLKNKIFCLIKKGSPHHKHLKQNAAKRPDICLEAAYIIFEQLGRNVPNPPTLYSQVPTKVVLLLSSGSHISEVTLYCFTFCFMSSMDCLVFGSKISYFVISAVPKSISFRCLEFVSIMFSGFRSRCTIPWLCRNSIAFRISPQ